MADGIYWAVDHGAKVLNISKSGGHDPIPALTAAVQYASQHDVVIVAGAGNVEQTGIEVGSPARIPGVVAVSGVDKGANFWTGSSRGPQVVLGAPAVRIIGPVPTSANSNGYLLTDGTSDATAIVSGVAALVRSKYPKLNAPSVINRLIKTAKDQGLPGRDQYFGFGDQRHPSPDQRVSRDWANRLVAPVGAPASPSRQPAAPSRSSPSEGLGLAINPVQRLST